MSDGATVNNVLSGSDSLSYSPVDCIKSSLGNAG